jgi:cardiolipin synthase
VASGGQVLVFNPLNPLLARKTWELNQRDHRKLLIVDGRTAFLGGINISSVYSGWFGACRATQPPTALPPAWRDTDLQLQGPVVAELQKLFLAAWAAEGAPLVPRDYFPAPSGRGPQVVRAIGSSPKSPSADLRHAAVGHRQRRDQRPHHGGLLRTRPAAAGGPADAAARGVDVKLILPGADGFVAGLPRRARPLHRLLQAGVKILSGKAPSCTPRPR